MRIVRTTGMNWSARRLLITLASTAVVCCASLALAASEVNTDPSGVVLHGYDPVAYFTQGKPVAGDEQFSAHCEAIRVVAGVLDDESAVDSV